MENSVVQGLRHLFNKNETKANYSAPNMGAGRRISGFSRFSILPRRHLENPG
jgi:hypothetical protein